MICNKCGQLMNYEDRGWFADPPTFIEVRFYRCSLCGHTQSKDEVISE